MNVLLDLLNDQTIESAPLSLIGQLLCDFNLISKASNVEQVTLLTRITTLLRSNHTHIRWRATRLFQLVVRHPALLLNTSHISNCLAALIKILESKCFIQDESNPTQRELICLRATVQSIDFAMDRIRGKANLTREVLTPKISGIIGGLIGLVKILPNEVIPVLYKLILNHSNTFRPFGTKLEKELLTILSNGDNIDKLNPSALDNTLKCLALLSFNLSRTDVSEQWSERMNDLILELRSVLSLYESLLDLESNPVYVAKLKSLPLLTKDSNKKYLFGTLDIDVNEYPFSIRQASDRISILLLLIQAQLQISTPNTVAVPFGQLITLSTLLINLPTLAPIKPDVRGEDLHNAINGSLSEIQSSTLKMLTKLVETFSSDFLPHMYDIFATLDSAIPVIAKNGKLSVNKDQVIESKHNILLIINLTSNCLSLIERWTDMSILTRIIDSSFILTEPLQLPNPSSLPTAGSSQQQQRQQQQQINSNGSSKKKNGKKSSISFSDYLSNPKAFSENASSQTMKTIRHFFKTLISKCELSTGKLNSIVRWAILDALNGGLQKDKQLLEYIVLYPGKSKGAISAYPMIVGLLEGVGSEIISLLMNPRFPLIPQLASSTSRIRDYIEEEEEEDEEEDENIQEKEDTSSSNKNEHENSNIETIEIGSDLKRKHENDIINEPTEKKLKLETEYKDMIVNTTSNESVEKMKNVVFKENTSVENNASVANENSKSESSDDDDEDMGSDFEIPEINVD